MRQGIHDFGAMRLHQLGVPVATLMGTAVSDEQIELLRAVGVKCVWVLLDGDKGGNKARPKVVDALAQAFFVRVVALADGDSPDSVPEKVLKKLLPWKLKNQF